MQNLENEITKERYEQLKAMPYKEQEESLWPDGLPADWEFGYGYYGHRLYERDGKYYVTFRVGDSCD